MIKLFTRLWTKIQGRGESCNQVAASGLFLYHTSMKIICYGDSNTWGFNPHGGNRFDKTTRWPAVMSACLGPDFEIAEEGLNGRTIGTFLPQGSPLNGLEYLEHILKKHPGFDIFILYLGINDLFQRDDIGPEEIAGNIDQALDRIRRASSDISGEGEKAGILLLTPLHLNVPEELSGVYRLQTIKSEYFYPEYERAARAHDAKIIETEKIISASPADGVHIEAEDHRKLGKFLCGEIKKKFRGLG